ncbi:MAG TPA: N-acetylmuramoyl-L-alanine amidase [Planctomycetota bacterium]|nr:N-acetylmuramoyl-L-alanine amidase [Dermatophilaceae bacterium]HQE73697.1 N-acetylmuramoyl-L-alanine amidase [Myxococcota bacterium]HQG93292.1 N-acetylmuramoyl-L-alanine amidase [Acidobacteriota bacterium]HRR84460.1 N-acetylmuramoyl-L-alanine amidase [Phycisphaerae bacterium]HRT93946.1 N-acetylmuramoyl-L-alanine amidase [Planctomycetota bacterium]
MNTRTFIVGGKEIEPPSGLDVLNFTDASVHRFRGRDRTGKPVTELVIHETVTRSAADTVVVLKKRRLGVHLILDEHGRFTQHGDLADDRLAHASQHNGPSIGIEVVTPYYPAYLKPGMVWSTVIDAPWAHKKKYVLPTPVQAEAVARFVEWVTSPASSLSIPRTWIGLHGTALAMGQIESAAKLKPGLYAHHYFGHADGAWLVLYAWLRLEAGLAPEVAFDEAARRATGVRRRVDLSDLMTAAAPKE